MRMLRAGDRLSLEGGYDGEDSRWLGGKKAHSGTLIKFIPGYNTEPAAVVRLDERITVDGVSGDIVVLELRYVGAKWRETGFVHVELCDFLPESKPWSERRKGAWVESDAEYRLIRSSKTA